MADRKLAGLDRSLRFGGIQDEQAKELVDIIGGFRKQGWPVKVFPKGIPAPDGVTVHTTFHEDRLEELLRALRENHRIDGVKIFPKGIPNPEVFHTEIDIR